LVCGTDELKVFVLTATEVLIINYKQILL